MMMMMMMMTMILRKLEVNISCFARVRVASANGVLCRAVLVFVGQETAPKIRVPSARPAGAWLNLLLTNLYGPVPRTAISFN
eukprot:4850841-Amphidinium_carterae.1